MTHRASRERERAWVGLFTQSRSWNALLVVVIGVSLVWIYASRLPTPSGGTDTPSNPQVGFPAPDFTLDTLDGQTIKLSDYHDKVVLINLWASWCPPCRAEMPAIEKVYRRYQDAGFVVLAVDTTYQDSEVAARGFVRELGLTFPILLDRTGATSQHYQLQALPTSFFVGRGGTVRDVVFGGPMNETLIATKIEGLLSEGGR